MTSALRSVLASRAREPTPCPSWCSGHHPPDEPHSRNFLDGADVAVSREQFNDGQTRVFALNYGYARMVGEMAYTLDEAALLGRGLLRAVALSRVRHVAPKSRRSAIR